MTKFTSFFARKISRKLSVLLLVFGTSFFYLSTANAVNTWETSNGNVVGGTVQFDWRGGTATYTTTVADGSTVSVTVNNTTANCIGTCTPIPDVWTLSINGQTFSGNTIEVVTVTAQVSGQVTIVATGIDAGFWGGWYGPIFYAPVITEPTVVVEPTPSPSPSETSTVVNTPSETVTATVAETTTVVSPTPPSSETSSSVSQDTVTVIVIQDTATALVETPTVVDTSTATSQPPVAPEPTPIVTPEPVVVRPEPVAVPDPPAPAPQPEPQPVPVEPAAPSPVEPAPPVAEEPPAEAPVPEEEPPPVEEEPPVVEEPPPAEAEPAPPVEEVAPEPPDEKPVQEQPEATPEPSSEPVVEPVPASQPDIASEPQSINNVDLESVAPETPIMLDNGVVLTAEVVVALQLLENPAELLAELFSNPAEVFTALSNIGADMSPEVREQSEDVVVAAVIVGNIATQAAATAAGVAAYRRKP